MTGRSEWAMLVTGGAGYIGSHTAKALAQAGYQPVVYDNLSSGHREAARWGDFVHGDIRDAARVTEVLRRFGIRQVIHFAGLIEVGRSVMRPDLFFDANVRGLGTLLDGCRAAGVERLVFSSSAAVYGQAPGAVGDPLAEDSAKAPSSPYGETKLVGEWMLADHCRAFGISAVALRYFNACGAGPSGLIGEAHQPETHLIPLASGRRSALVRRSRFSGAIFRHPTGRACATMCVSATSPRRMSAPLNGSSRPAASKRSMSAPDGASVFQVIDAVSREVGRPTPYVLGDRRPGDPAVLVADVTRAAALLGWRAKHAALCDIVADAVTWRRAPRFGLPRPPAAAAAAAAAAAINRPAA